MLHVGAQGLAGFSKVEAVLSHKEGQLVVHVAAPYAHILPGPRRNVTRARARARGRRGEGPLACAHDRQSRAYIARALQQARRPAEPGPAPSKAGSLPQTATPGISPVLSALVGLATLHRACHTLRRAR